MVTVSHIKYNKGSGRSKNEFSTRTDDSLTCDALLQVNYSAYRNNQKTDAQSKNASFSSHNQISFHF